MKASADVVVVGAGLSGLRAATRLAEGGASVRVVEARDRVGGRTLTREVGGKAIDLGGQWIGPGQARLAALAEQLGVQTFPTETRGIKVLERASGVSTYKGAIPSVSPLALAELQLLLRRTDRMMTRVPLAHPERAAKALEWDACTLETWKQRIRSSAVRDLVDVSARAIFGAEPRELSFLHFLFYLHAGGGLLSLAETEEGAQQDRFVQGAQSFSKGLAAPLGEALTLEAPVRRVVQSEAGVVVHTDQGPFSGRYAILALPPTLAGRIDYEPLLPAARDQLTQRYAMGATTKVFVFYERPFWRDAGRSGEAVSSLGPLSFTFDNSVQGEPPHHLLGFMVGETARYWAEQPQAERERAIIAQLERLFGPEAAGHTQIIEHCWAQERWTRGCPVGAPSPGTWTQLGGALRAPCGRLHWAGTETAREWNGYLEGALEAGDRAAREVLERL